MKKIDSNFKENFQKIYNQFQMKKYDSVISKSKKIIKQYGEIESINNLIGASYQCLNKNKEAIIYFKKTLMIDPVNLSAINNLGNIYKNTQEFKLAEVHYLKLIRLKPSYVNSYANYGNLKKDLNNFSEAIELYKKALEINPNLFLVHYNLALAYQSLGQFEKAIKHCNEVIKLNPDFTSADYLISSSQKYKQDNAHLKTMEKKKLNKNMPLQSKINLNFAIGKAYEDIKNYEKSFEHIQDANNYYRSQIKYSIKSDEKLFQSIKNYFQNIPFSEDLNNLHQSRKIIFILGMPRSGTTLTEQILSSNKKVYPAGELGTLSKIIAKKLLVKDMTEINKEINIKNFKLIKECSSDYFNFLDGLEFQEKIITDKAPLNFRWIGFIKLFFPNAKIVHCFRNPLDNCLSLYKNLFEGSLEWSYTQEETAKYFNLYKNLMNFWNIKIPNYIYNLNYESLVNNTEVEIKNLIKFCDLEWSEEYLKFYENKNPIKTASVAQARQPIYKTSMKSFQNYERFLPKLIDGLKE